MKVVLICHNIPIAIQNSVSFLKNIEKIYGKISLHFFSNAENNLIKNNFNCKFYNLSDNLYKKNYKDVYTSDTSKNIKKQIFVLKKSRNNLCSQEVIKEHERLLNLYFYHFNIINPDIVIVWNGITHSFQTASVECAKKHNIPVLFIEKGMLPNNIFYDQQGVNKESSIANNYKESYKDNDKELYTTIRKLVLQENKGSKLITNSKPYILLPLQRDIDSNILFNSKYISSMYELINKLEYWGKSKLIEKYDILIKPHPEDKKEHYTNKLKFLFLKKYVENTNLTEIINKSDCVITINSTVGFTSMILEKPVISLGDAIYTGKNLCTEMHNDEELLKTLNKDNFCVDDNTIKRRRMFINHISINNHIMLENSNLLELQNIKFKSFIERLIK